MTWENFSIGAFYNITKNQDNPIKTVGGDSFLSPKTPKNTSFLGVTKPWGVAQPLYSREHNQTQTYNICPSLIKIGSKTVEKNSAQTNKQTNRHYENNGHLAVNQYTPLDMGCTPVVRLSIGCVAQWYNVGLWLTCFSCPVFGLQLMGDHLCDLYLYLYLYLNTILTSFS